MTHRREELGTERWLIIAIVVVVFLTAGGMLLLMTATDNDTKPVCPQGMSTTGPACVSTPPPTPSTCAPTPSTTPAITPTQPTTGMIAPLTPGITTAPRAAAPKTVPQHSNPTPGLLHPGETLRMRPDNNPNIFNN